MQLGIHAPLANNFDYSSAEKETFPSIFSLLIASLRFNGARFSCLVTALRGLAPFGHGPSVETLNYSRSSLR